MAPPAHQQVLAPEPGQQQRKHNERGAGRPKGSPNKVGMTIREMILNAIDSLGGENYFVALAVTQPQAFASLVGKVLPTIAIITPGDGTEGVREIRRSVVIAPPKK